MLTDVLIAFGISLAAGLIGSMVGIGGGIINAPYLSYLNYIPSQISSTSLIAVFFTSISSLSIIQVKNIGSGEKNTGSLT